MNKTEALLLADALERQYLHACGPAADELRRLSAVEAQRDALLEVVQSIADCCDEEHAARDYASRQAEIRGIARAAIKAVEGTK